MGSVRGRELRCRVAPRGGAFDRGFARTAQRVVPVFINVWGQHPGRQDAGRRGQAEAGGSPSSEAPPGDPPEVFDRRWIGSARNRARKGVARAPRSGIGQSRGCSYRALVAEVGETHLSRCRGEPRGNLRGARAVG